MCVQIATVELTFANNNFNFPCFNEYSYCVYLTCCYVLCIHELYFLMMLHTSVLYIFPFVFGFSVLVA